MSRLTPNEEKGAAFAKTRSSAKALLALKPAEQETVLLRAIIKNDLFGRRWRGGEPDEAKTKEIRDRLAKVPDADGLVGELLGLAKADPAKWAVRVGIVFSKGGGLAALARLKRLPRDGSPLDKEELTGLIAGINERHGTVPPPARKGSPSSDSALDAERRARLRKVASAGVEAEGFWEAFEQLTRHDPGTVGELLVKWKNTEPDGRGADLGYILGSYFGWKCGRDRAKHFSAMTKAGDPFVRVAGAVYLCFEDSDAGKAELKKLTPLDGDPGVWAALTLARRGDREAVPRALRVFKDAPPGPAAERTGMSGVPHGNLQKRVLVLLSNAAQAGGLLQPAPPEEGPKRWEYLVTWWKEHGEKAVVRDPWLKALEKQKVD